MDERTSPPALSDPFAVVPVGAPEPGGGGGGTSAGARSGAGDGAGAGIGASTASSADAGASAGPGPSAGESAAAGEGTPAALLAAARALFAQQGYEGASVRAITSAAGANLGAITYHFGSKRALYDRVVEMCVSPLVGRVEAALSGRGPVLDRLEGVVRAYFDHFVENPDLPHLMLQEVVLSGMPPAVVGPFLRRIYTLIVAAIREGQASGEVRPGDPMLMGMSLISQPIFPMLMRHPIEAITGLNLVDAHTRERVVAHVAAFARAGLAGPSAAGARVSNGLVNSTPAAAAAGATPVPAASAEET